jgi:hypothetical protein
LQGLHPSYPFMGGVGEQDPPLTSLPGFFLNPAPPLTDKEDLSPVGLQVLPDFGSGNLYLIRGTRGGEKAWERGEGYFLLFPFN